MEYTARGDTGACSKCRRIRQLLIGLKAKLENLSLLTDVKRVNPSLGRGIILATHCLSNMYLNYNDKD
jgi:hypothetical protein